MNTQTPARYNNSFFFAEHVGRRFVCQVPVEQKEGFQFQNVLKPGYWAHVAHYMKPWDVIEIRPDDFAYKAELVVIESGHLFAKVALVSKCDLSPQSESAANLEVEWSGPATKWRVKRGRDVLKDGLASKDAGHKWITDEYKAA